MECAIAHAFFGTSFVAQQGESGSPDILRLKDDDAKDEFVLSLTAGDKLYLELGGPGDNLAYTAMSLGCEVLRIPTFKVGNKQSVLQIAAECGWSVDDERAQGEESSDELTVRKTRALAIFALAQKRPQDFVKSEARDADILQLKIHYRGYKRGEKWLLASYLAFLAGHRDLRLIELAREKQREALQDKSSVYDSILHKLVHTLLTDVSAGERKAFLKRLGVKQVEDVRLPKSKDLQKAYKNLLAKIIGAMVEGDKFTSPLLNMMKEEKKAMQAILDRHPVYLAIKAQIPGFGVLTGAAVLNMIVDIRRFESFPSLKAFAGYHHFDDGSRARRVKGRVSNWSPLLKQAIWKWCQWTLKSSDSPYFAKLGNRRAYELIKLLKVRQSAANEQGLDVEILPIAFRERSIAGVADIKVDDLPVLLAHVDALYERAGTTFQAKDEEEGEESDAPVKAKDPKLAKLVRGLKKAALDKALRWLGQQKLKGVYATWRKTIGLSEFPDRSVPLPVTTPSASAESPATLM
jgi:hypothetical protein